MYRYYKVVDEKTGDERLVYARSKIAAIRAAIDLSGYTAKIASKNEIVDIMSRGLAVIDTEAGYALVPNEDNDKKVVIVDGAEIGNPDAQEAM